MTTSITIELTDEMVTALRNWQRQPVPPGESSFHIPTVVATLAANQLPAPPVRVNVELPAGLAEKIRSHVLHVPDDAAVDLWRHVEQSLRQLKDQGVPLA